jgi:hypothetical protein
MLASVRGAVLNVANVVDCLTTENYNTYQGVASPQAVIAGYVTSQVAFTGSIGSHFTSSGGSTTTINVTAIADGYISVGDTISGGGLTVGTTIVSQTDGTPGGIGHYVTSVITSTGSWPTVGSSTILDVTAVASGILSAGQLFAGAGVTGAPSILLQISGTTGGIGTYRISGSQQTVSPGESMTAIPTLVVTSVLSGAVAAGQYLCCAGVIYGTTVTGTAGSNWAVSASQTIGNPTYPIAMILGAIQLVPESIYVAVAGGAETAVATAIWTKKAPGCAYNGGTTVTVYDTSPPYPPPGVPYSVTFDVATDITIFFAISIANSAAVPSNAAVLIQNAILAAFSGSDGGQRPQLNSTFLASRFYSGIAALGAWARISALTMGSSQATAAVMATSSIAGATLTVGSVTSGTIAIGQQIVGTGVVPGTVITAGSGSSWTVSPGGQTVASTTINAYAVTATSLTMLANQEPVTAAPNIIVTLV